jgi:hypothetical protein
VPSGVMTEMKNSPADRDAGPFGVYWELISRGAVVGHGFARGGLQSELPERPGCSYHVWSLGQVGAMVTCKSLSPQAIAATATQEAASAPQLEFLP